MLHIFFFVCFNWKSFYFTLLHVKIVVKICHKRFNTQFAKKKRITLTKMKGKSHAYYEWTKKKQLQTKSLCYINLWIGMCVVHTVYLLSRTKINKNQFQVALKFVSFTQLSIQYKNSLIKIMDASSKLKTLYKFIIPLSSLHLFFCS